MRLNVLNRLVIVGAIAVLSACGGGGSSKSNGGVSSTPSATAVMVSGTVASGAPMIGKVTVYDSNGVTRTTDILANGAYNVNVSGLVGPFLFRATGTVAGRTVSLTSAAISQNGDQTINITPFTDLLVANVVGMAVENYLANHSAAPTSISASTLSEANQSLTQKLLPMLQSAGLTASFDLLHSSFSTNHTGFDKLMDAVIVSVNAGDNTATIVDKLNTATTLFNSSFSSPSSAEIAAAPSASSLAAVDDLTSIETVLTSISSYFVNGVPSANNIPSGLFNLFDANMLQEGHTRDEFLSDQGLLSADQTGLKIQNPVILAKSDDGNVLLVRVAVMAQAEPTPYEAIIGFKKTNGAWKFWGNRSLSDVGIHSTTGRTSYNGGTYTYARYLEAWIESARNDVETVLITGPGLHNDYGGGMIGVKLARSVNSATVNFELLNPNGTRNSTSLIDDCAAAYHSTPCINLAEMVPNGKYYLRYFDVNGQEIVPEFEDFREVIAPPPSIQQAMAHANEWFANITSMTPSSLAGYTNNTAIRSTWSLPSDPAYLVDDFGFNANGDSVHFQSYLSPAQTSALIGTWVGNAPSQVNAWIFSRGPNGQHFFSTRSYGSN